MASKNRLLTFTILILTLFLVACTRPLSRDGGDVAVPPGEDATEEVVESPTPEVDESEEDPATATPESETEETEGEVITLPTEESASPRATDEPAAPTEAATDAPKPTIALEPTAEPTAEEEAEAEPTPEAEATEEADPTPESEVAEATETTTAEEPVAEQTPTEEAAAEEEATGAPVTHTVQPGENLYRIGLQYGVSWVTLAQANQITNPNQITAGQILQIPTGQSDQPSPTPSPTTELIHTVQPGDNLYKIGLAYGITWDQIAEANGIVNPNQIYVGQELKIPSSAPGPSPQFTHIVQPGETLLRISIRYGVTWQAIAEANNIRSPYVIYAGQTLVIPGE